MTGCQHQKPVHQHKTDDGDDDVDVDDDDNDDYTASTDTIIADFQ